MLRKLIVTTVNFTTRLRRTRVRPGELLLLLPHCLQNSDCTRRLNGDIQACSACGKCDLAAIRALGAELGVACRIAGGGRQALEMVRRPEVRAVIAVACGKELAEGVRAAWPKPILCVTITTPCGFCRNTRVDIDALRNALRELLTDRTAATNQTCLSE